MPPGYRERTLALYHDADLEVRVLSPLDFVIAKLRRFSEEDIADALFVIRKYGITVEEIRNAAEDAILHSIQDTALFLFRKNVGIFLEKLKSL